MKIQQRISIWWGPPKEFTTDKQERRVSWLELFFDLVFVIAIARTTHLLAHRLSFEGFTENLFLFILIYWGWLNGSLHHDLHGNQGLRTRLMTLWQMMIIASLAIVLYKMHENYTEVTLVFIIMQLFVTYMWWSVGLYDKTHRKYSWPYTTLFLLSAALMALSLLMPNVWLPYICTVVAVCNYAPPFIAHLLLTRSAMRLDLSNSMFERLGLFTIIIFGELVVGVVNGIDAIENLQFWDWINFALGVSAVFSLWWIFFTLVSSREVKEGFNKGSLLELLYIPTLMSLGFIAASMPSFFAGHSAINNLQQLMAIGISVFMACIFFIMRLLVYPGVFDTLKKPMGISLLVTAGLFMTLAFMNLHTSVTGYFTIIIVVLVLEITFLNYVYYGKLLRKGINPLDV